MICQQMLEPFLVSLKRCWRGRAGVRGLDQDSDEGGEGLDACSSVRRSLQVEGHRFQPLMIGNIRHDVRVMIEWHGKAYSHKMFRRA